MESVSAIIVTRGDVNLNPIFDSLPEKWEHVVWDNSVNLDLSVYGRYAAIQSARHDIIYVQDDDVIVSNPTEIVDEWAYDVLFPENQEDLVVCNMPPEFRHDFYEDHALVGFGAVFHRSAPEKAFRRFHEHEDLWKTSSLQEREALFNDCCDIVFTTLTPRILVDVPVESLDYASDAHRMWKQPGHQARRNRMRAMARRIRDAD